MARSRSGSRRQRNLSNGKKPQPKTPELWLKEIELAWQDAAETIPFAEITRTKLDHDNLFMLAPHVCLKFRGLKLSQQRQEEVIQTALANYVANRQNFEGQPRLAFALVYVATHLVLELIGEETAEEILWECEDCLEED